MPPPYKILYYCNDSTSTKTYKKEHSIILSVLPSRKCQVFLQHFFEKN